MTAPVAKPDCAPFADRLLEGVAPASDPALAEHVGSCLGCFRLMTDLRQLPRIARALRGDEPASDPGEAFWTELARRVMTGIDGEATAPGAPLAETPPLAKPATPAPIIAAPKPGRLARWARGPMAAALGGAAAAAALLALVLVRHPKERVVFVPPEAQLELAASDIGELGPAELAGVLQDLAHDDADTDAFVDALHDDDPSLTSVERLAALDTETLRALRTGL